jgi:hypothetical protein
MTAAVHVFVGPSLPAAQRLADGVVYHPPVRHGDLFALDPAAGDRILIIDGVYQQDAPIRHKEIVAMLRRGVAVFGAASLGALRAAELETCGMVGLGLVFAAYRNGELDADADVAVLQADADHDHRSLTVAQVTVLFAVRALVAAGSITPEDGAGLADVSAALHFTERNPAALQAAAAAAGLGPAAAAALLRSVGDGDDVKQADAAEAIRMVVAGEVTPVGGDATAIPVSSYEAEWTLEHTPFTPGGPTRAEILTFVQLALPDYPERHRRRVRRVVSRAAGLPADSRATDLLAAAGMRCAGLSHWTAERILVRSFRVAPGRLVVVDLPDEATWGLDRDELVDDCRTLLELSREVAARVSGAPHWAAWPDAAVDTELRHAWCIGVGAGETGLELAAVERGFRDLDEARRRARRFTPGLWWLRTQAESNGSEHHEAAS